MLALFLLLALQTPGDVRVEQGVRVERDVLYRSVAGVELCLDASLPEGPGPFPAILLVHGGAWKRGDKRDMAPFAERLVPRGYACFAPSYRLAPAHPFPAQIEDCLAAVRFVRAEAERFRVDEGRIGALGLSAGGHLVSLLGVLDERAESSGPPGSTPPRSTDPLRHRSSRVQCVVSYFGPVLLTRTRELAQLDTRAPSGLFGVALDSAYAEASPLRQVSAGDAPFLLVHGDADALVPIEHAHLMKAALDEAGVACELVVIPGGGHGDFFRSDPGGEYWQRTEAFLDAHLRPGPPR